MSEAHDYCNDEIAKLKLQNGELRGFILKNSPECPGDDPCSCVRCRFALKRKCQHKTVPTFDGLGVRLKCQTCGEWVSG